MSDVYLSQGLNYVVTNVWKDPHVPYRTTDKGRFNWKPNDDETIWRNLTYLLDEKDTPQIVEQRKHLNLDEETIHLVLYGVQTNKASYLRQQRHDLRLPVQLIGNEPAERFIHRYIERAEQLGEALYRSLNQEEISKETRVEAQQRIYPVCEQNLWDRMDTIIPQRFERTLPAEAGRDDPGGPGTGGPGAGGPDASWADDPGVR